MAKAANNPSQPQADAPGEAPVWTNPYKTERQKFKDQQRAYRGMVQERKAELLEAGERQYRVALCAKDGNPLFVLDRGRPVRHLIVGGASEFEARDKFIRHNGLTGGTEAVKVIGVVE